MGHREKMTNKQRLEWDSMQYKAKKDANKGHNYQYYSEELQKYMDEKGYVFYPEHGFNYGGGAYVTRLEYEAKQKVEVLRVIGYHARIICGYEQNVQKIKMYSIICKNK